MAFISVTTRVNVRTHFKDACTMRLHFLKDEPNCLVNISVCFQYLTVFSWENRFA